MKSVARLPPQRVGYDYPVGCVQRMTFAPSSVDQRRTAETAEEKGVPPLVNISTYSLIVVVHVLAAITTFAFMAINQFALIRANSAPTTHVIGLWLRGTALTARLLPLGSLLLLVTGVYLAWERWGFGSGWIEVSALSLLLISIAGNTLLGPRMRSLGTALQQAGDGPVSAAIRARLADPVLWTTVRANAGGVIGIVFLMEIKPALLESLAVVALAIGLGAASALPFWSHGDDPRARPVNVARERG
jgi:hypothetical protein